MTTRLMQRFTNHAQQRPDVSAVCQGNVILSYGSLFASVDGFSAVLRQAVPPGGVVMLCSPNQPSFVVAFLAALRAGVRLFPVSDQLPGGELASLAQRSSTVACVGCDKTLAVFRGSGIKTFCLPQTATTWSTKTHEDHSDRAQLLLQSSGTTTRPKIVIRTAPSLDHVADNIVHALGMTPKDRLLITIPLCHSYGTEHGILAPLWAGSCVRLRENGCTEPLGDDLMAGGITLFPGVPPLFASMADSTSDDIDFPSLRCAYSAGAALPRSVFETLLNRHALCVGQLYGSTEVGSVTFNAPAKSEFDPGSVGVPFDGVDLKIFRPESDGTDKPLPVGCEGQIAISSPSMMVGYLDERATELRGGYCFTGDLGKVDQHGRLSITGRLKLMIDIGGLNVNPLEVEHVIAQHPSVHECVVVPVRLTETVSRLKAIIVPSPSGDEIAIDALRQHCRQRLAPYKVPRVFETRASLNRSTMGKVIRQTVELT